MEIQYSFAERQRPATETKGSFAQKQGSFSEIQGSFVEIQSSFPERSGSFAIMITRRRPPRVPKTHRMP